MDFEKEYNAMVQRCKELHDSGNALTKRQMEIVCPSLAETEDERIRKALIQEFKEKVQKSFEWKDGIPNNAVLAWLEKQKETQFDAKLERVIRAARRVLNNWLDGGDCPDVSGDFTELEHAIRGFDGEEKQKEQKPHRVAVDTCEAIDKVREFDEQMEKEQKPAEWDDYTKTNLDRALQIIKAAKGTLPGYQSDDGIYECDKAIECLEHFLYRGLEIEKPAEWSDTTATIDGEPIPHRESIRGYSLAEWSEEDSDNLERVDNYLWMLDNYIGDDCAMPQGKTDKIRGNIQEVLSPWLKSLPERFSIQPKQEWSEEDSKRYISIGVTLETSAVLSKEDYDANMAWLRELVHAKKYSGPQSHWKPSEEQIYSLGTVVKGYNECTVGSVGYHLKEMYEHLKKLI